MSPFLLVVRIAAAAIKMVPLASQGPKYQESVEHVFTERPLATCQLLRLNKSDHY